MTTEMIRSDLAVASSSQLEPSVIDNFLDHSRRSLKALAGFDVYGAGWLKPWIMYCLSPIVSRSVRGTVAHFRDFNSRLDQCDLYTFANIFADYPCAKLVTALREVKMIVDRGANVGAFSLFMLTVCRKLDFERRIVALEPESNNAACLRGQPFADGLEIHQAAVGPTNGTARLVSGKNSVTHQVDLVSATDAEMVPVLSLDSLCDETALVKMDIEGGERSILERGLPEKVRHLVLEWHGAGEPSDFVSGNWQQISTDMRGASTWWFRR